jgi:hypothetical protein
LHGFEPRSFSILSAGYCWVSVLRGVFEEGFFMLLGTIKQMTAIVLKPELRCFGTWAHSGTVLATYLRFWHYCCQRASYILACRCKDVMYSL